MLLQGLGVLSHFKNFYVETAPERLITARLNLKLKKIINKMLLQGFLTPI